MQALPAGEGDTVGLALGLMLGLVLGEPGDEPLGLVLGDLDGLVLGDACVLPRVARGLVVPGPAALLRLRPAGVVAPADPAPADPAPADGRGCAVVALADVDPAGVGLAAGEPCSAPDRSSAASAAPVATAAPTASAAARCR